MKKAAFVDVDGTLTDDQNAWEKVHRKFGFVDEMKKHHKLFFSDKITYQQWASKDVKMWKGKPYSEFEDALKNPILLKKAKEGTDLLKANGFEIVLISGGLTEMVKNVASEIEADYYISNDIGQENGLINGTVTLNVGHSKEEIVKQIAQERNYDLNKSIAIGDGFNDIDMFKLIGFSVALNPKSDDVAASADSVYFSKDFQAVVESFLEFIPS